MENGSFLMVPLERYEQLIRAEHDANQLKALIEDTRTGYGGLDYDAICTLHSIYIGKKEDDKV